MKRASLIAALLLAGCQQGSLDQAGSILILQCDAHNEGALHRTTLRIDETAETISEWDGEKWQRRNQTDNSYVIEEVSDSLIEYETLVTTPESSFYKLILIDREGGAFTVQRAYSVDKIDREVMLEGRCMKVDKPSSRTI